MQNDEADIIGKAAFHPELSVIDMNDPDQYRARKRRRHSPDALDRPLTNLILVNRSSNGTGDSFTNPTGLSGSEGFASKLWGGDSLEQNPSSQATHSGALDGADSNATPFWCFGMVRDIQGTCQFPRDNKSHSYPIYFNGTDGSFFGMNNNLPKGKISTGSNIILAGLLDEPEIILEISCRQDMSTAPKQARAQQVNSVTLSMKRCLVNIIIYGRSSLLDDVGSFFEEHDIHLQNPEGCQMIVPYNNPHKLPAPDETVILTSDLKGPHTNPIFIIEEQRGAELLDELESQHDLAESEQPPSIQTMLQRHQLQALTFMLGREQGWAWDGSRVDIWEFCEDGPDPYFINRVSNAVQLDEPPQFYGGIIADPMGLGKTLSMIGLIACDITIDHSNSSTLTGASAVGSSDQTLVVVPPPLLIEWERQFKEHIVPGSLPWAFHYGKSRLSSAELESTFIVLTTYHTVSMEWKNQQSRRHSILFQTKWKRVILDEAHFIRNSESQMAQAICSLDSVSRWAVTGTPIQNRLADLATLLKFLNVYPYSDKRAFENDISRVWKSDGSEEAIRRLQRLAGCLILRRPKTTIDLPPRHDHQCFLDLDPQERYLYNEIRVQTVYQIEQAIQIRDGAGPMTSYTNVLQRIEAMRMVCNLGLHYHNRKRILESYRDTTTSLTDRWEDIAQRAFDMRREMDTIQCQHCSYLLWAADNMTDQSGAAEPLFTSCWQFTCSACASMSPKPRGCTVHNPPCPVATVSTREIDTSDPWNNAFPSVQQQQFSAPPNLPTKVSMLIHDLQAQEPDAKSVVFSTWRTTLDVVETGLRAASIPFVRFDGKVLQKDRQAVVDRFRTDPSIKVVMLTLACGATGLTLTEATRAYLMEPNWNPTVEDQALARIHRIGQTKPVTTIRFIVRDSFEQRVVELQKTKRDLGALLLGRHSGESVQRDSTSKTLELLRALV